MGCSSLATGERLSNARPNPDKTLPPVLVARYLFWGVLLFDSVVAELVIQSLSVLGLLDSVDPHQPVLGGERLLQVLQPNVLVTDLSITGPIEAWWRAEVQLHRTNINVEKSD